MQKKIPAKAKPGVIVKIPINNAIHTYAQYLEKGYLAIFDAITPNEQQRPVEEILACPVLFSPVIFDSVKTRIINKGVWPIIGFAEIDEEVVKQIKPQFHLNENSSSLLYYSGETTRNVDPDTMYGLFPISVSNEHNVLSRLEAYVENRYSNAEILAMLDVYFRGQIPWDFIISKSYLTWPRSKPLPKPNELTA
ncbi:Imm26 family immunity protein [Phnomibacter sp. MR]|uniref:Imm26 family immunity protein n=1 Tax=Phnomibacter sp. MR TaxID=3042318 RepID=UPI003A80C6C1